MTGRLNDQVAFITGAARGQGRAHAVRLAEEGADIIAVDISEPVETIAYDTARAEDMEETVRLVEARGRRILASEVDVRDLGALTAAADAGMAEFGRIDIVLANAGVLSMAPTLAMDERVWQTMIDINLTGVWKTLRAAVPHIQAGQRGGAVVITSSLAATTVNANLAHYASAKAGLVMLGRTLARELAPESIRVNMVHPTTVATDMVLNPSSYRTFRPDLAEPTRADFEEAAAAMNLLPVALVEPEDVSEAVLYLVTEDSRYVTGTSLMINAGMM
ncbi:mycofactocin-coupled SDR family oxidoreductase [Leucobacter chromiireducens]|uniref:NAD(P)-dependent oxidoreductase n=1 Tax=Leucobacter chromiireducens subsp. solipictus TaxID=398235 RepID=A0ABS1SJT3_9MICO|nr:mycofactocin-coupled SDR family oxidoreductase [Leucobacter chromiireducens]MBL3680267.1 NAD(P)-dependent oxidoreductase [Leucobacter chromiireducens subsp. solipictus]